MKKTILIADSSEAYLGHLAAVLKRMGFAVVPVERAVDILSAVKDAEPDFIIIDEDISTTHCLEILDWLRHNRKTSGVNIVVMSSHPDRKMRDEFVQHGSAAYIRKPITLHVMHKILEDSIYAPLGYHRRHLRAMFCGRVTVRWADGEVEFTTESLSEGGIFLATNEPLPVGTEVQVSLDLEHGNYVRIGGRVIYINRFRSMDDATPMGMAIEFTENDRNKLFVISDYVKGLLTIPTCIPA